LHLRSIKASSSIQWSAPQCWHCMLHGLNRWLDSVDSRLMLSISKSWGNVIDIGMRGWSGDSSFTECISLSWGIKKNQARGENITWDKDVWASELKDQKGLHKRQVFR
jgi:hypothetical protein